MFGTIAPRMKTWLVNFLTFTGRSGETPAIFRRTGAVPGVAELNVYHDGTQAVMKSFAGPVRIQAPNTGSSSYLTAYDNGGNSFLDIGATSCVFRNGLTSINTIGGGNSTYLITSSGITYFVGPHYFRESSSGTIDSGISRFGAAAVQVNNGTATGLGTLVSGSPHTFQGVSSTTTNRSVGYVTSGFVVSTDASYTGYVSLAAQDFNAVAGGREGVRVSSSGTAAMVGFFGTTPVVQQTGGVATAGATYTSAEQAMLQAVYDAVRAYGLMT